MKASIYEKYYKLGLEHFVNKKLLKLHRPSFITDIFYLSLILVVIVVANLVF